MTSIRAQRLSAQQEAAAWSPLHPVLMARVSINHDELRNIRQQPFALWRR
ncbi:MAG: hypothetical protein VB875_13975 [Pirellulales bacterium]